MILPRTIGTGWFSVFVQVPPFEFRMAGNLPYHQTLQAVCRFKQNPTRRTLEFRLKLRPF